MVEPLLATLLVILLLSLALGRVRHALRQLASALSRRYQEARSVSQRGESLLRGVLTTDEYERLSDCGYLDVRSPSRPGRVYRVPRDGGIVVIRENRHAIGGLCIQAVQPVPASDSVAMHKLMIEGAEEIYLQTANHLSVGTLSRYGLGVLYER